MNSSGSAVSCCHSSTCRNQVSEGDPSPLVLRKVLERPLVVEPVGELHENDTCIAGHREQHLPIVLDLLFGGRPELDPAERGKISNEGRAARVLARLGPTVGRLRRGACSGDCCDNQLSSLPTPSRKSVAGCSRAPLGKGDVQNGPLHISGLP